MAVLALRVTDHNGLNAKQKRALAASAELVDLGIGAMYENAGPPQFDWLVYADARFDLEAAALLAVAFRTPALLPDPDGLTRAQLRANIKAAFTWEVPTIPEGEDPYAYTAAYNATNPALRMWTSLPAGYTPKEVMP